MGKNKKASPYWKTWKIKMYNIILHITTASSVILTLVFYRKIPDEIPSHYNYLGKIDAHGGEKGSLLMLLFLIYVIYGFHWVIQYIMSSSVDTANLFSKNAQPKSTKEDIQVGMKRVILLLTRLDVLIIEFLIYAGFSMARSAPLWMYATPIFLILFLGNILFYFLEHFYQNKKIAERML